MNPIAEQFKIQDFDAVRLKLASPEVIKGWSYGEVSNPETINYRTQKPEKGGLFAEEIFGPSKDWECYCGKYKKVRYKGIICDKCGVEVTHSLVRRERMGHIALCAPVSHIWFLRGVPSKIGLVLDLSVQNLEKVIYFANFIVIDVDEQAKEETLEQVRNEYKSKKKQIEGDYKRTVTDIEKVADLKKKDLEKMLNEAFNAKANKLKDLDEDFHTVEKELKELEPHRIISESTYQDWSLKYGHVFNAGIGAEAIHQLLKKIDLGKLIEQLEDEMADAQPGARYDKLVRRVKLLHALQTNGIDPHWMVMTMVPVIPPDLRPMVPLDGGRFAASDLNDLYRRVINRNNRLKKLEDLNAPEVITRNEKRMLQEAVDALIDNSARQSKTVVAATGKKRQLKSLADILKGKQGRFRQNLLGKRIDYSGRSVIVVGPKLKLDQCGLPKKMALELFKPFVISKLIERSYCHNIRSANRFIESDNAEVWDILEEVTKDAIVLLNRAPTLHRLGIQGFHPILIEGKAIHLHPMVCSAFNADFDGDQMAVHVPLTEEAKIEAKERMLSTNNLLKPATGAPIMNPSMDIAWGIYYMTTIIDGPNAQPRLFSDPKEAILAYRLRKIQLREKIRVRMNPGEAPIETNTGRILLNRIIPQDTFGYVNERLGKSELSKLVRDCIEKCGNDRTVQLLDDLKDIGYHYCTVSGYSWGASELPTIPEKKALIDDGDRLVEEVEEQYQEGLLTQSERHSKIVDIWSSVKDKVTKLAKEHLPDSGSVSSMINSGARGSWGQLTQIIGMKGLVASPSGAIIELPVKANFKDGFDVLEYFISTHGARKGLSDTALRTANAGYLTRRLVDVAQDVVVREEDCGDKTGNIITKKESEEMGQTVVSRILGRYILSDIKHPKNGRVIVKAGDLITEEISRKLEDLDLQEVHARSVLECHLPKGICQKCYGYDLAFNQPVKIGVPVGIMAAQSIGEPGTQLTMRTFHTGGVAGSDITQGLPRVEELFESRPPKRKAYMSEVSGKAKVEEIERRMIEGPKGQQMLAQFVGHKIVRVSYTDQDGETYKMVRGDESQVEDGAKIKEGQVVVVKADGTKIAADRPGTAKVTKKNVKVLRDILKDKEYIIPPGFVIYVKDGDDVEAGQPLTDGHLDLQMLYRLRGQEAVQKYILKDVQAIYTSQGQKLNDKHIEIIIRQMFSRVNVVDAGDTDLLPGEIIERAQFMIENARVKKAGGQVAKAEELFLGITKVSLSTQSFLSAASFQETARVLINAAVTGKVDPLEGLKENIIIGRLIPAGTGLEPPMDYEAFDRERAAAKLAQVNATMMEGAEDMAPQIGTAAESAEDQSKE
ncbi:MAG: DNA-directed RNA polymerase subunit beta' [Patescibacteria group bacterium]